MINYVLLGIAAVGGLTAMVAGGGAVAVIAALAVIGSLLVLSTNPS